MPAIEDDGDVYVDDVAILKGFIAGYAMANDVVDGGADGLWEAFVVEWGGNCSVIFDHFTAEIV